MRRLARRAQADVSVRVAWLVAKSQARRETAPVPGDLVPAVDSLRKKMQIGELATATQLVINVNPADSATFNLSGTADLKESFILRLTGALTQNEPNEYQFNLQFHVSQQKGGQPICSLNTTCSSLVPGHPVIVGMTTVDSQPSLFIIELLPK